MNPRYFLAMVAFAFCGIAAAEESVSTIARVALSAPEPHPTRADRLVVTTEGGLEIEYSPGQEADVQAVADRMTAWNQERVAQQAREAAMPPPAPTPLSARDFREGRDMILQRIAKEIGLDAPTELQSAYYDTFLDYYEMIGELTTLAGGLFSGLAQIQRIAIWARPDLVARLAAGETIPGFSYDAATGKGSYDFKLDANYAPTPEERAELETLNKQRLDHSFNYKVEDGIAYLSASVTFKSGQALDDHSIASAKRRTLRRTLRAETNRKLTAELQSAALVLPALRHEKNAGKSPAEFADEIVTIGANVLQSREELNEFRSGSYAMIVLHETAEVGLLDRYIGSRDRRWLCDGVANYVAWKIARDLAGPEFAREVYNLDAQLTRYAALQKKINLRKWPAVEHQPEADQDTPLNRAHYAFATRAIMMMAQQYGEESVPKLFREVGKTPRKKVSMKTVERAFAKITGGKLRPF